MVKAAMEFHPDLRQIGLWAVKLSVSIFKLFSHQLQFCHGFLAYDLL
jgi:hypothetical protein